jgi:hypothetical protein
MMMKKKTPAKPARTTIASVNREMQQPRLTESARNGGRDQTALATEKPPARSAKV